MILILGATGYVGSRLVHLLVSQGNRVRAVVRQRARSEEPQHEGIEIVEGDALQPETLLHAFEDIDVVYYLVHSMTRAKKGFEDMDRRAAANVARAAEDAGVKRIIYLGGLGRRDEAQSPHLRSRHEVGDILRTGKVPVTEFRAAVIIGSGSASFEMVHHLVNRLPVMICPRWVTVNTQPIGIDDVLRFLTSALTVEESTGQVVDIGGPEILSYREMMLRLADALRLRRLLIQVPVLTPRLSSYWVNLVTPVPAVLARTLIDSLRHETIVENKLAQSLFDITPISFNDAVRRALGDIFLQARRDAGDMLPQQIDPSHFLTDIQMVDVGATPEKLFAEVASIGGEKGWYFASRLWQLRGFIDRLLGGIGFRKGRRHPSEVSAGDRIDFWRVEQVEPNRLLSLRAEMNVWGCAWLDFRVHFLADGRSRLVQTARYYPRGLGGLFYWWAVYPIHVFIFRNMARAIARAAESS